MKLTAISTIMIVLALTGIAHGQDAERLYGVWEMTYYSRAGQVVDWTGIMIITPKYFTRNYMAKQRATFRDQYENLVDLPEGEKDAMLETLYSKYGSASGTYTVENDTLTFEPIVGGNPALLGRRPSRQIDLDPSGTRLSLKGTMTRGYGVEEVWVRLEDFD
jgi:hypothetical protein